MNWEKYFKRIFGVIIIVVLLGFAFDAHSANAEIEYYKAKHGIDVTQPASEVGAGTQNWMNFLIHIRQGEVDAAVIGGKCLGKDEAGNVRTVGCARWKKTDGWLDGECWITVREWNSTFVEEVLKNWGHELAHCVKGVWHE
jgi:hypothetical protein